MIHNEFLKSSTDCSLYLNFEKDVSIEKAGHHHLAAAQSSTFKYVLNQFKRLIGLIDLRNLNFVAFMRQWERGLKVTSLIKSLVEEINRMGVATVAKRSGISRQHLYKILAGTSNPTSEKIEALSQAVGCNVVVARSKYYPADPYKEQIINDLLDLIREIYDPQEVWLFGSQARGDWKNESDIDLMIVGRKAGGAKRGEIYVQATRRKIRASFDAVFITAEDFEKSRDDEKSLIGIAVKEGQKIYSRGSHLK